LIEHLL